MDTLEVSIVAAKGTDRVTTMVWIACLTAALVPAGASAAPSAETTKSCMRYSYLVDPHT